MVKTLSFRCRGPRFSSLEWGVKIPQAVRCGQKKFNLIKKSEDIEFLSNQEDDITILGEWGDRQGF